MATSMAATLQLCSSNLLRKPSYNLHQLFINRRSAISIALSSTVFLNQNAAASAFELRFTVPDQTVEEAEAVIRSHAQDLLQIKALIESESWRDAQFALRESSSYLKQDLYTIIQGKPGSQRALLRKLYSTLFNNVSKLDYAARSKDAAVVKECYNNIVATLDEIFAKI